MEPLPVTRGRGRAASALAVAGAVLAALVLVAAARALPAAASTGRATRAPRRHAVGAVAAGTWQSARPSWSIPRPTDANDIEGSLTTARIDGVEAVVFGTFAGTVDVVNAATGKELPGWPRTMAGGTGAPIWGTPAVASLDGPGRPPTIVVGSGTNTSTVGEVEAFRANGTPRFVFRVPRRNHTWLGVFSSPAIGDVTGNGQPDIVFGSWDHDVYALTPQGRLVRGFPYDAADTVWSSPALYRPPGSRADDIYIGEDASGLDGCRGGWIEDLHVVPGRGPVPRWRHCEPETIWSSPAIGVLDETGRAAVVVGTGYGYGKPFPAGANHLYAYYADNGAPVPGWPVAMAGATSASPAIGPLRPGGPPAVVESARVGTTRTQVAAWSGAGHRLWSRTVPGTSPWLLSSPVLVPLLRHAANDVLVGTQAGLYALDGATGSPLYGTLRHPVTCPATASPVVVDATGWRLAVPCGSRVVGYPLPVTPEIPPAWPMFRQNPAHTGLAG